MTKERKIQVLEALITDFLDVIRLIALSSEYEETDFLKKNDISEDELKEAINPIIIKQAGKLFP